MMHEHVQISSLNSLFTILYKKQMRFIALCWAKRDDKRDNTEINAYREPDLQNSALKTKIFFFYFFAKKILFSNHC